MFYNHPMRHPSSIEDAASQFDLRRGPWTLDEDNLLSHYIACHGEGRWNSLAKSSGLKRTGKSCRLRWLNYLKPDIKRGDLSTHEQLLILELHSKLGNRWSKIARYLPGRTDNEIKNYWRTRVEKQARQLNIDSNSIQFLETIRSLWMPRLLEMIKQSSQCSTTHEVPDMVASWSSLSSSSIGINKEGEIYDFQLENSVISSDFLMGKLVNKTNHVHNFANSPFEISYADGCFQDEQSSYGAAQFDQPTTSRVEWKNRATSECYVTQGNRFNDYLPAATLCDTDQRVAFGSTDIGSNRSLSSI